jgi:hypothetical protein
VVGSGPDNQEFAASKEQSMVRAINGLKLVATFAFAVLALWTLGGTGGCAGASVTTTERPNRPLPKPDMIIVNDFAVSPGEVKLDRGVMSTAVRDAEGRNVSDEENRVGHIVADKLSTVLVEELRKQGISAVRGNDPVAQATPTSVVLNGEFLTIDQGNQTYRVWLGFGLGGSEIRTNIQAYQNGELVAQAETATKSSLKPGMLTSVGVGAAADSGAAVVAGAVGTGVSEAFLSTVEADARRTAKEIAKRMKNAYVQRGWLAG